MDTNEDIQALGDAFVVGNANPAFIGAQLAQFVRRLIGASLAQSSYGPTTHATTELQNLLTFIGQLSSPTELREAVATAVSDLTVDGDRNEPWLRLAEEGTRYLLEKTTSDGFNAARVSKAKSNLIQSSRYALGLEQ